MGATRPILLPALLLLSLLHSCSSCIKSEREALLTFKHSLSDPSNRLSSWINQNCCNWEGVYCNNKTGHVVELDLGYTKRGQSLVGSSVNPSLVELKQLRFLSFRYNDFGGSKIPEFIGNFNKLRHLDLSRSNFGGPVPASLGQLSKLEVLDLRNNSLTGVISETHFERLSRLVNLDLGLNYLVFNISSNWTPPFQIRSIALDSCRIGPRFPNWIQTQSEIQDLVLMNTSITDSIPSWFSNIASNFRLVNLGHNLIRGSVPDLSLNITTSSSLSLLLYSNNLEGPLPPFPSNTITLDLSDNFLSGHLPENISEMMPILENLLLYNNSISGSIPVSLCEISELEMVALSHNKFSGEIPWNCWSNLKHRSVMAFANNNLTGVIPSSNFSDICALKSLKLNNNNFYGEIPSRLRNCTGLNVIGIGENGFSGNIAWVAGLVEVTILSLRSNELEGNIPLELCHAENIHILDLAENKFSGTILPCFMNFTAMKSGAMGSGYKYLTSDSEYIQEIKGRELNYTMFNILYLGNLDLSSNHLEGRIPEELTLLIGLRGLQLSNNHLTGEIPKEIGSLRLLESLDISNNRLTGTIPESISKLNFLSYLNFSNNNFSGLIPKGNQLQTFDPSIYSGNPNLCGMQIQKLCEEDEPVHMKGEDLEMDQFYISMIIGFVVGLYGGWGVLFSKKNWRVTYFRVVENVHDLVLMKANCFVAKEGVVQSS